MASPSGKNALTILLPLPAADGRTLSEAVPVAASDEALVRGALAGDRAAWQVLIARHDRKVVVSLLARGLPLERAKEVAQETWTRLMENQRAGRLERLVLPGLAIVQAGYLASSERRRQPQGKPGLADAEALLAAAAAPAHHDPELRAIDRQALARVARALDACPARARRVFEAVYQHPDLSYDQIAARLHLSTQRVKQTVCEVRKRLRAVLTEEVP